MSLKILDYFFFARPMLIIPVWTVYLHYRADCLCAGFGDWEWSLSVWISLAALTLVFLGTYVVNQIYDIESDRINHKLFYLPQGIISVGSAWTFYALLTIGGLLAAAVISPETFIVAVIITCLGFLYSAPYVRLKDSLLGGLLINSLAYGLLIPWIAGIFCAGRWPLVGAIPYFLAIAAGYVLTTIPDAAGDARTGKTTMAVALGGRGALWLGFFLALVTAGAAYYITNYELAAVGAVAALVIISAMIWLSDWLVRLACKLPILLLTIFAGIHYPLYMIILLLTIVGTRLYYKKRFDIVYPRLD